MSEEKRSLWDLAADFLMHKHGHYYKRILTPDEFRAALKEAIAWGSQSRWISVKDRLPEVGEEVLVFGPSGIEGHKPIRCVCFYDPKEGRTDFVESDGEGFYRYHATHWMPLPADPPKEDR